MRTEAVILKTRPWREYDLFVRCFTERAGIIAAVAKGALRGGSVQGMHLRQGNVVRFELVSGRGMPVMTGAFAVSSSLSVSDSWLRQTAVWSLLESMHLLVHAPERDERLWRILTDAMRGLDTCTDAEVLPRLRTAQRDLLGVLGYAPQVGTCGVCGNPPNGERMFFSVELGSVVCAPCSNAGWYGVALGEDDRQWLARERSTASCAAQAVRAPTERLMEYIAGRKLSALNLLFGAVRT